MSILTKYSGYVRRYINDDIEKQHRFEVSKSTTEYGNNQVVVSTGSSNISILPPGIGSIKTLFLETDNKVNVTLYGNTTASLDILANGVLMLTGSISDIKLSNRSATNDCKVLFDLSE